MNNYEANFVDKVIVSVVKNFAAKFFDMVKSIAYFL